MKLFINTIISGGFWEWVGDTDNPLPLLTLAPAGIMIIVVLSTFVICFIDWSISRSNVRLIIALSLISMLLFYINYVNYKKGKQ